MVFDNSNTEIMGVGTSLIKRIYIILNIYNKKVYVCNN